MSRKRIIKLLFLSSTLFPLCSHGTDTVTQQQSAMDSSLKQEATVCAAGDTPGTIGYAIKQAIEAHTQIASATPAVESLFSVDSDCFSGATNLFDLSFAIPSLSSIISSAEDAVKKYAAKKVCTAVDKVSGMVTTPINNAIDVVKQYDSINNAISGGMGKLDPNLGSAYHGANTSNYNVNVNPFNTLNNIVAESAGSSSISVPATATPNTSQTPTSSTTTSSGSGSKSGGYLESVGTLFTN